MNIKAKKSKGKCTLAECPPGLFLSDGVLGFKTEYGINLGQKGYYPEAFVVASGEVFWGGAKTHEERSKLMVQPLALKEKASAG